MFDRTSPGKGPKNTLIAPESKNAPQNEWSVVAKKNINDPH